VIQNECQKQVYFINADNYMVLEKLKLCNGMTYCIGEVCVGSTSEKIFKPWYIFPLEY